MWERDILDTQERYRRRWARHGYDPKTLGWNKGLQEVRFRAALEGFALPECSSILDVGCGFGDLLAYLREGGWTGSYTGVDVVPELVAEAGRRHGRDAGAHFINAAFARAQPGAKADLVVSIGVFNHSLQQDSMSFIAETIGAMWDSCRHGVVCDFLSSSAEAQARQQHLFYADPAEILQLARRFSRRVLLHHAYMPFEFMVKIWRDQAFTGAIPVFRPYAPQAGPPATGSPGDDPV